LPVRRVDLDRLDVGEEGVEARSSEDPDLGGAQADFPFDWPLEELDEPESRDDEPEPPEDEPEEEEPEDSEEEPDDPDFDAGAALPAPFDSPVALSDVLLGRLSVR
jgi:hypothetical protein